jgi:5'(3')-deoxyribonucleotidase
VDIPDEKGSLMKTLYIDMDNVLVDFKSGIAKLPADQVAAAGDELDNVPGIFALMEPMPGAVAAFTELSTLFDVYILSTAPWGNPTAWSDKLLWVKRYLGKPAEKRLILSHHKNLNRGDFIVDDRTRHGVDKFQGMHIHFGTPDWPDWQPVLVYLRSHA